MNWKATWATCSAAFGKWRKAGRYGRYAAVRLRTLKTIIGDTIAVGVKIGNNDLKRILASEHPF